MEEFDSVILGAGLGGLSVAACLTRLGYRVAVYQEMMTSVRDLIPDVDRFVRMKVYGTPTTSEFFLGQPEGNIYGAKLVPGRGSIAWAIAPSCPTCSW